MPFEKAPPKRGLSQIRIMRGTVHIPRGSNLSAHGTGHKQNFMDGYPGEHEKAPPKRG